MRHWKAAVCLGLSVVFSGCIKSCVSGRGLAPEQVVEAYLQASFNLQKVEDRNLLMIYTTGPLKEAIGSAQDAVIKKAYIDRRYQVASFSVVERRDRTPRETDVTFQLKYRDLGTADENIAPDNAPTVTTENTVSVVKEKGEWLIRDVVGAKTSIDFAVSKDAEIKPRPEGERTPPEEVQLEKAP